MYVDNFIKKWVTLELKDIPFILTLSQSNLHMSNHTHRQMKPVRCFQIIMCKMNEDWDYFYKKYKKKKNSMQSGQRANSKFTHIAIPIDLSIEPIWSAIALFLRDGEKNNMNVKVANIHCT